MMISEAPVPQNSRRERILDSATRSFGAYGYHAASLRDIAKDAGCSLTLLNHHFGNKAMLLQAVVHAQNAHCSKRLTGLKHRLQQPAFEFDDFIATWVDYEYALYDTAEGRAYLMLMLRLQSDRDMDPMLRSTLNCAQATVLQGLAREWPALDEDERTALWHLTSGALYASVTGTDDVAPGIGTEDGARDRTVAYLLQGMRGFCELDDSLATEAP